VIATAMIDTGSVMDTAIAEEFRGKSNAEIVFDRELANMHVYPAIDVHQTGTRREDTLFDAKEIVAIRRLRKALSSLDRATALERLVDALGKTSTNAEFLSKPDLIDLG